MTARYDRRTVLRRGGAALATLASAGCVGGDDVRTVEMAEAFAFAPSTVSVSTGATVRWENVSDVAHTVTAYEDRIPAQAPYFASGGFASEQAARSGVGDGLVEPGDSYAHTFEVPGTYEYFCVPHEGSGMVGTVRVG